MPSKTPELIGRYQVVKELKSGGMGTVFLARDPRIGKHMGGRFVAIKVLQEFDDVELRARFEREADIAGTLDHRNIVQIYDRDEYDGRPFIVMEFVDGRTLSELIDSGAVPLVRKLQWMEELCDGLACAHHAGVVHRDIKPANVMIRVQDGVLKILDFGIARANTIKVNMTRGILGTLNYMAPEQWDATGTVDSRADVFASGAVFYELLAGEKAFPGVDVPSIYRQIASLAPEPLENRNPNLDPELIAIVNRCLEKRPADRYPEMELVRSDLTAVRQRLSTHEAAKTMVRPARSLVIEAQQALEHGEFTKALTSIEQALRMEPDNSVARDIEGRARAAVQVHAWLRDARGEFERGALTAASILVDQVLEVNESEPEALSFRLEIEAVRQQLERAQQIDDALARARAAMDAGALDDARAAVDALTALAPEHAELPALSQRVESALEERRIAEENTRAAETVADARRQFAAGRHSEAMAILERHRPPHTRVAAVLTQLRAEYEEIERRRREAERRREEEARAEAARQEAAEKERAERAAEQERAQRAVQEGRRLTATGDLTAALAFLEAYRPEHPDVVAAASAVRTQIADIERQRAEAQRREQARIRAEEERRRLEDEQRRQEEERQRAAAERQKQEAAKTEALKAAAAKAEAARVQAAKAEAAKAEAARVEAAKAEAAKAEAARVEAAKAEAAKVEAARRKQEQLDAERRQQEALAARQRADQEAARKRDEEQQQADAERRKQAAAAAAQLKQKQQEDRKRAEAERQRQETARIETERRKKEEEQRRANAKAAELAAREEERRRLAAKTAAVPDADDGSEATVKLTADLATIRLPPAGTVKPAVPDEEAGTAPGHGPRAGFDRRLLAAAAVLALAVVGFGVMKWRSSDVTTPAPPAEGTRDQTFGIGDAKRSQPTVTAPTANGSAVPPPAADSTLASASPAASTPPSAAAAPPAATPAPTPPSTAPAATAPPAASPTPAIDSQVAALRTNAAQQWARDDRDRAMATLASAAKLKPEDADTLRLTRSYVRQIADRATAAATSARNAGVTITPGSPFDAGRRRQREAADLDRAGKPDQSVRAYGDAIALFTRASSLAAAARSAPPPPVTAVPAGPPPRSDAGPANNPVGRAATPPAASTAPPPASVATPPATPPTVVAATPPPNAPASSLAGEEAAIRQVLQRYRAGYEGLNSAAVKAVFPGIDAPKLANAFKQYTSLKQDIQIDRVDVAPDGQTATVTGAVTTAPVVKTGKATPARSSAQFRLKKSGDQWLIQDINMK